jgi:hypothetical protein
MSEQAKNPFDHDLENQITAITGAIGKTPRIVQCIQACNEENLIEACMLQLYDKVDRIIVIEGAVTNKVEAGQATPDGHSIDRTVDIIKEVKDNKDPDKKIIFVQIDRPWADLEEIKNTFFQYMQDGDWMLITDADEFIMPNVVDDMRLAISMEPFATEFIPAGFYHFWRDAWHMRRPSGDWGQQHQRFIRFQSGLHYVNHPVARDAHNVCTYFDPRYLTRRFVLPGFVVYHYSYCKDDEVDIQNKKDFYTTELGQAKHGDIGAYARGGQTDEYLDQTEDLDTVLRFDGVHPPAMATHPMVQRKDKFLASKEPLVSHMEVEPYSLKHIPIIWIYAVEGKDPYDKFYQTADVA